MIIAGIIVAYILVGVFIAIAFCKSNREEAMPMIFLWPCYFVILVLIAPLVLIEVLYEELYRKVKGVK